ncbi:MAG: ATPase, T2SS/T4P/T4SS family [Promethearchaeota archaeon]
MVSKNISYFQEKENLTGKKDTVLTLDCKNCLQTDKNLFGNQQCLSCLLYNLYLNRKKKFSLISLFNNNILIEYNQFVDILEYYNNLKKIRKLLNTFIDVRRNRCIYKEFKCDLFQYASKISKIRKFEYHDPILLYKIIWNINKEFNSIELKNPFCLKCHKYLRNLLEKVLIIFNNLKLINNFQNSKQKDSSFNIYEFLLDRPPPSKRNVQYLQKLNTQEKIELLQTYKIGEHYEFQVKIYQTPQENEKHYKVGFFLEKDEDESYFNLIIKDITINMEISEFDHIIPIEKLIELYNNEAVELVKSKYKLPKSKIKKLGFLIALKKLRLYKIFPLLTDDYVEEIFLDSPNNEIYVNHQIHGRCRTDIKLVSKEIDRLKTFFRLYSGKRLDYMNPSIKLTIKNQYFNCRFAIDTEPIQIDNFALDIRKLNKNILTIQDLLKNKTLNPVIAAFLYFILLRKRNITITGETDTGKTTLINALDLLTPKEFRKIYVENVTESLDQFDVGKHQLKYRVDSLEDHPIKKYSKSNLIKTLLHRTPDLIYLGEILTKEEAEAMFHCLAAGLKGFQTIHANTIESLMNRFLYHFKIKKACLFDLDILILMKKGFNTRKIISVSEIRMNKNSEKVINEPIFLFDPNSRNWKSLVSLYETKVLEEIIRYERLPEDKFKSTIEAYTEIFECLSSMDKLNIIELTNLFHRISYFSFISLESVRKFWNEWKIKMTLNQ